ncbi:hypothetical protein EOM39_04600 [Candidatus Gracilibacteria bacterium]|nr:hypothetical protein [Candidatus Gracilibacteria bacterium]
MKIFSIFLILFGVTIIVFPKFLAYLIGGFFIFLGISILTAGTVFSFAKKKSEDNYIKFGKYKIYR